MIQVRGGEKITGKIVRAPKASGQSLCHSSTRMRREGMELILECDTCEASAGLDNARCYRGALNCALEKGRPTIITFSSFMERRYDQASTELLGKVVEIIGRVRVIERHIGSAISKDSSCENCLGGLRTKIAIIERSIVSMEPRRAISAGSELGSYKYMTKGSGCSGCSEATRLQVTDIIERLGALESYVVQNMFGIVGESDG